jgi:DNA-binding response OmpR family regulator
MVPPNNLCGPVVRVLVVEDEVRIAEILQAALSRSGFVVDPVRRCGEAREALSLTPYDAVVLDLGLPDGSELRIHRVNLSPVEVRTVFMSASTWAPGLPPTVRACR